MPQQQLQKKLPQQKQLQEKTNSVRGEDEIALQLALDESLREEEEALRAAEAILEKRRDAAKKAAEENARGKLKTTKKD